MINLDFIAFFRLFLVQIVTAKINKLTKINFHETQSIKIKSL
ncbi:hypothetical protein P262_02002 [Cronobacter malonaticus]|uniref:Uncharacterized protein n=1 Tax=Cronobacter malonaticus TaxID=413503 RepID=V5TXB4_9ENTR|nr:hypothetical protein P262_02002 [Cronobacter malonaticus]